MRLMVRVEIAEVFEIWVNSVRVGGIGMEVRKMCNDREFFEGGTRRENGVQ